MDQETQEQTLSKIVSDRLSSGQTVLDILHTETPTLADTLGGLFGPWLADPAPVPFASLLQAFHGRLSECRDRLADAAECHLDVQSRADELGRQRDDANDQLAGTMSAMRATFRGVYGCAQLAHFGFPDHAPRRPRVLLRQSRELHRRLSDPELDLPASRVPEFDLDCAQLARKIAPSLDGFRDALATASDFDQDLQESERLQNEALAEYNEVFLQIAGSLESWLRMAGHDGKADRVRPSRRRPGLIHCVKTASS